jgi:hypothetical protein
VKVLRLFCVAIIFDILFFYFRAHKKKKKLSLEPLLKLATFIDAIINCKNILEKIVCCRRIRRRQKRCSKTVKFFLILLFHIQNFNHLLLKVSSYSKKHKWEVVKKLCFYLNSKCLK